MASYRKRSSAKQEEKVSEFFTESGGSELEQEEKELSEFLDAATFETLEQIELEEKEEIVAFIEPVITPTEYVGKDPGSNEPETTSTVIPVKKLKPKRHQRNIPRFSKMK